jgi:ABC-type bacteriocin/lantibiotic exporter with double-glycine peptidase domain
MYSDLQALSNGFAAYVAAKRRRMTHAARAKFQASVAELGKMISLLVMLVMIAPILVVIPAIGVIAILLPVAAVVIIALYGLESWETLKRELERMFKTFAQDLSKAFEK